MNRRTYLLVAAVLVIAPLLAGGAEEPQKLTGEITQVEANMLNVLVDAQPHSYLVTETTKISLDGQPVRLARLMPGMEVDVVASQQDGKAVATSVEARAPKKLGD